MSRFISNALNAKNVHYFDLSSNPVCPGRQTASGQVCSNTDRNLTFSGSTRQSLVLNYANYAHFCTNSFSSSKKITHVKEQLQNLQECITNMSKCKLQRMTDNHHITSMRESMTAMNNEQWQEFRIHVTSQQYNSRINFGKGVAYYVILEHCSPSALHTVKPIIFVALVLPVWSINFWHFFLLAVLSNTLKVAYL